MEKNSISIVSKDDIVMEISLDVAKKAKAFTDLISTSGEDACRKEPIPVKKYDASTLYSVFEWCTDTTGQTEYSEKCPFTNAYDSRSLQLSAWHEAFLQRNEADLWTLVMAAVYLQVPLLYDAACLKLSEIEWRNGFGPVPRDVSDPVLCDVLCFLGSRKFSQRAKAMTGRWAEVVEGNRRFLPLQKKKAELIAPNAHLGNRARNQRPVLEVTQLEDLREYAVTELTIGSLQSDFGEELSAAIEAFLNDGDNRLRVKSLEADLYIEGNQELEADLYIEVNQDLFQDRMMTLRKLTERLRFLDEIRLCAKCDMIAGCLVNGPELIEYPSSVRELTLSVYDDGSGDDVCRLIRALNPAWTRPVRIKIKDEVNDPWAIVWNVYVYEIDCSGSDLRPLDIFCWLSSVGVANVEHIGANLTHEGFTAFVADDAEKAFEKELQGCWKLYVKYSWNKLTIEVKKVAE